MQSAFHCSFPYYFSILVDVVEAYLKPVLEYKYTALTILYTLLYLFELIHIPVIY